MRAPFEFTLNGHYIYEYIDGFNTVSVRGRETYDIDNTYVENVFDGSTFQSSRLPSRKIEIDYLLICEDYERVRSSINKLNELIMKIEIMIIFDDENDKYYVANYDDHSESITGHVVEGTITFICDDPYKYAVEETSFDGEIKSTIVDGEEVKDNFYTIEVVNDGNVDVPIDFTLINRGQENGLIGIASADGAMQFGDIKETDEVEVKRNETLLNYKNGKQLYSNIELASTTAKFKCHNISIAGTNMYVEDWVDYGGFTNVLQALGNDATKEARKVSGWHSEGLGFYQIPQQVTVNKSLGTKEPLGTKDFTISQRLVIDNDEYKFKHAWIRKLPYATGRLIIGVVDSSNKELCSYDIYDGSKSDGKINIKMYVNGKVKKTYTYSPNKKSFASIAKKGSDFKISKKGEKFIFEFGSKKYTFTDTVASQLTPKFITLGFFQVKNETSDSFTTLWVRNLKFTVTYGEMVDYPNRYDENSEVFIDGKEGKFYVDGLNQQGDEVLGTTYLKARANDTTTIGVVLSDWVDLATDITTIPTVTATIRKAWK